MNCCKIVSSFVSFIYYFDLAMCYYFSWLYSARSLSLSSVHGVEEPKKKQVEPRGIEALRDRSHLGLTITVDSPVSCLAVTHYIFFTLMIHY